MKTAATVENRTELPPAVVQALVGWALSELDVDRKDTLCVIERTDHAWHLGQFYSGEVANRRGFKHLLVLKVPKSFPYMNELQYRGGPPKFMIVDWEESLVCITAHEGTHLKQSLGPERTQPYTQLRRGKVVQVDGARLIEVEAEWAEFQLLELYRERRTK